MDCKLTAYMAVNLQFVERAASGHYITPVSDT
jgi:hypothetical protein